MRKSPQTGFTLVELMIVVAVMGIIAIWAVPSFQNLTRQNRLITAANELSSVMQYARAEAVQRARTVDVCPTTDGSTCGGSDWSRVLVRQSAGATAIRDVEFRKGGNTFVGSTNVGSSVSFLPTGFVAVGTATPRKQSGAVSICNADVGTTFDVIVEISRVKVERRSTSSCAARQDPT